MAASQQPRPPTPSFILLQSLLGEIASNAITADKLSSFHCTERRRGQRAGVTLTPRYWRCTAARGRARGRSGGGGPAALCSLDGYTHPPLPPPLIQTLHLHYHHTPLSFCILLPWLQSLASEKLQSGYVDDIVVCDRVQFEIGVNYSFNIG